MKKRYIFLTLVLILGSFACFLHPSFHASYDWILFLLLFSITALLLGFQFNKRPKKHDQNDRLFNALREGVVLIDSNGQVKKINQKAAQIFGGSQIDLLGEPLFDLPFLEKHKKVWMRCEESQAAQVLNFSLDEEGKRCFDGVLRPFDQTGDYLFTIQDTSGQYQKHQLGKDFVANASHELRTPITIIKGFAETIYELPEISASMLEDFMEKIVRNCHRMDNLVKNLLILADLDYLPKARLQECDLVALIDNCSHTLLSLHPDVNIEVLQNEEVITIFADPDLLELAIMNLLENAVKYSKDIPFITITVEDGLEEIRLTIADRGIGIPESDLHHIFDRFYTVDKTHSRKLGGAGLGLSIVKTIIEKHEGTIEAYSSVERGTQFVQTFQKINQCVQ